MQGVAMAEEPGEEDTGTPRLWASMDICDESSR
jgi:hypothetical protein